MHSVEIPSVSWETVSYTHLADGTDEKVFVYGDTTFNAENDESDVNPHNGYSGWACIRYGIGETLFHYSDSMEIEPWLAESYELVDDTTWRITLHEGISFTSGRTLDAEAVKECLEDLIAVHDLSCLLYTSRCV